MHDQCDDENRLDEGPYKYTKLKHKLVVVLFNDAIQCNLDYPDPRLSGLAGDQKMHYYACAEGVVSDLLWVWSHIE